jgi:lycopene cyclase domain-containing protein
MAEFIYLVINLCVFLPLFIGSYFGWLGIKVGKQILYSYLLVSLPFIIWDIIVTRLGHWSFSQNYTLGLSIAGIPFEEILFFLTVPYGCIYVWEALKKYKNNEKLVTKSIAILATLLLSLFGFLLLIIGGGYSHIAGALLILTSLTGYYMGWFSRYDFWLFQVVLYCLFIGFNLILTALPIVTYSSDAITGLRFITIPIEDFAYNFILINLSLFVYEKYRAK